MERRGFRSQENGATLSEGLPVPCVHPSLLSPPAPLSASACKQRPGLSRPFRLTMPPPATMLRPWLLQNKCLSVEWINKPKTTKSFGSLDPKGNGKEMLAVETGKSGRPRYDAVSTDCLCWWSSFLAMVNILCILYQQCLYGLLVETVNIGAVAPWLPRALAVKLFKQQNLFIFLQRRLKKKLSYKKKKKRGTWLLLKWR